MRKILLVGLCLVNFFGAYAQNKTLGVGVATPNPNAALHVESPGGNQGFLMPRLTTAQRLAMNALLTAGDKGLMLYDTDQNAVYIWDGLVWGTPSEVENLDPTSTSDAFTVLNTGKGSAARLTTNNTTSKMPVLWAETNSDSAQSAPIYGLNTGTGDVAASFRLTNPASPYPALFAESSGTGRTATFRKLGTTGSQPAVFVDSRGGHGIWADHNSASGYAAIIQTINTGNTNAGMLVESIGTGPSIWALKSTDAVSGDAFKAENWIATGSAGNFSLTDAANDYPAIAVSTVGAGPAIRAYNDGTGNGFAGEFSIGNSQNQYPAIQASSAGPGSGVRVMQSTGTGAGVDIFMQNTSSSGPGVAVDQQGLGHAGSFIVSNGTSGTPAVQAVTNGSGSALEARTSTGWTALSASHDGASNGNAAMIEITNSTNAYPALQANTAGTGFAINARHTGASGDAIYAEYAGTGDGSAGNFRISNLNNNASAVYAATNGNGPAMGSSHDANGIAFAILNGGVQITTSQITTGTSLATRASAYQITSTSGTAFTIDFGPKDGEVFMVYNETAQPITVGGTTTIPAGQGMTFVVFPGGQVRGF